VSAATLAAGLFTGLTAMAIAFQIALAAGAPWGTLAMGGRFPGRLPALMRWVCLLQIGLLASLAAIVLTRAGWILSEWSSLSRTLVWGVVAVSALSLLANLATPSRGERMLWAPVAAMLLLSSILVAKS